MLKFSLNTIKYTRLVASGDISAATTPFPTRLFHETRTPTVNIHARLVEIGECTVQNQIHSRFPEYPTGRYWLKVNLLCRNHLLEGYCSHQSLTLNHPKAQANLVSSAKFKKRERWQLRFHRSRPAFCIFLYGGRIWAYFTKRLVSIKENNHLVVGEKMK